MLAEKRIRSRVDHDGFVSKMKMRKERGQALVHLSWLCTCATHLLDRVFVILKEDRPYQLRDVDGTPVTRKQARAIIAECYTVPAEVRRRNNRRARKERAERRMERKHKQRESRRNR